MQIFSKYGQKRANKNFTYLADDNTIDLNDLITNEQVHSIVYSNGVGRVHVAAVVREVRQARHVRHDHPELVRLG